MRNLLRIGLALLLLAGSVASAKEFEEHTNMMDHGGGHLMDMGGGMVMGQNVDRLPDGCTSLAGEKEITVHAGHKHAKKFPGRIFAFDTQEYQFEPCTKLTVNFVNDDSIRHQWMMHGLPKYMYPKGMFHLEVTGPGKISGTLILPPGDKTYLVHCDIAQHMEKGMKAQLKVGSGSGDLPSIPGITPYVIQDSYIGRPMVVASAAESVDRESALTSTSTQSAQEDNAIVSGTLVIGLAVGLLVAVFMAKKYKGKTVGEVIGSIVSSVKQLLAYAMKLINWLIKVVFPQKKKELPKK
ncbi:MAG: copper oxidase [Gammaproteobacteria bacterium]